MIRDYDKDIRTLFLAIVRSQMAILKVRKIPPYLFTKSQRKTPFGLFILKSKIHYAFYH